MCLKVIEVIRHPRDKAESKYNPDVGVSKEDEDRYQKLLMENEELQKLIAAVSTSFTLAIYRKLIISKSLIIGPHSAERNQPTHYLS